MAKPPKMGLWRPTNLVLIGSSSWINCWSMDSLRKPLFPRCTEMSNNSPLQVLQCSGYPLFNCYYLQWTIKLALFVALSSCFIPVLTDFLYLVYLTSKQTFIFFLSWIYVHKHFGKNFDLAIYLIWKQMLQLHELQGQLWVTIYSEEAGTFPVGIGPSGPLKCGIATSCFIPGNKDVDMKEGFWF